MIEKHKKLYIALILLIQSAFSIFIGLLIFFLITQKYIAPGVYIGDVDVGKMDKTVATQKIEKNFSHLIESGSFDIVYNKEKFNIKYSDISAKINSGASIAKAMGKDKNGFLYKFNGYFSNKKNRIDLVLTFNEVQLKEKLGELEKRINKKSVDADIALINGKVIKKKDVEGQKLDITRAFDKLVNEIPKNPGKEISFNKGIGLEIERVLPQFSIYDFNGAEEIVSQYSTVIKSSEFKGSIKTAVRAINKVILLPGDKNRGFAPGTFSFNKYLAQDKVLTEENDEGYNQVGSTLNAAVLNSEMDIGSISRTLHGSPVDYIGPGLDIVVNNKGTDYKFMNTYDHVIIIFAEVAGDKIKISLVGTKPDSKVQNAIDIEVVQRFDPGIVNTENQNLKSGEKRMISPGKEGIKVNVYRVSTGKGIATKRTLLYPNIKYDSVNAIVETGSK